MSIVLKQPVKSPAVITNGFGDTTIDYSRFALKGHNGIDYAGNLGDPVFAAADGKVEKVGFDPSGWGNYVRLRHGTATTIYAHLKMAVVMLGDTVTVGQKIGEKGYSGNVVPRGPEGTHLHFGLRFDGANENDGYGGYVDPLEYIRWTAQELTQAEEAANENGSSNNENGSSNNGNDDSINKIVRIVSKVASNARLSPGGNVLFQVATGVELQATGRVEQAAGLLWRQVLFPVWIAERDWDGTRILGQRIDTNWAEPGRSEHGKCNGSD